MTGNQIAEFTNHLVKRTVGVSHYRTVCCEFQGLEVVRLFLDGLLSCRFVRKEDESVWTLETLFEDAVPAIEFAMGHRADEGGGYTDRDVLAVFQAVAFHEDLRLLRRPESELSAWKDKVPA